MVRVKIKNPTLKCVQGNKLEPPQQAPLGPCSGVPGHLVSVVAEARGGYWLVLGGPRR